MSDFISVYNYFLNTMNLQFRIILLSVLISVSNVLFVCMWQISYAIFSDFILRHPQKLASDLLISFMWAFLFSTVIFSIFCLHLHVSIKQLLYL